LRRCKPPQLLYNESKTQYPCLGREGQQTFVLKKLSLLSSPVMFITCHNKGNLEHSVKYQIELPYNSITREIQEEMS
jgi:hypothetical protein